MKKIFIALFCMTSLSCLAQSIENADLDQKLVKAMYLKDESDLKENANVYDISRTKDMARLSRNIAREFYQTPRCINTTLLTNSIGLMDISELRLLIHGACYEN